MSEEVKTISYLGVALVTCIFAFVVSREAPEKTAADVVGENFVAIESPVDVKRLSVVRFDSDSGEREPFEVAQIGGAYSIPSHFGYPADARDHLVDAVNIVNNCEILASVSDSSGSHEEFGVIDPEDDSLRRGATGVGTRVKMSDAEGEVLSDFVIGKEVKDSEGQRYVRHADKDQVYVVEVDAARISTRFEDWIERDLLKFDPIDLQTVSISDYSVVTEKQLEIGAGGPRAVNVVVGVDMKSSADLKYEDLEWQLKNLVVFEQGQPKEISLGENEEVNKSKLDDMKYALDDLEIVDVQRKTEGLEGSLQDFVKKNPKAAANLEDHGFFFRRVTTPDGERSVLLSNNGEVTIGMKDGVEYVLRFGNVAGAEKENDQPEEDQNGAGEEDVKDGEEGDDDESSKVLRYLFVLTQLNDSLIEKPELEEVPPEEPLDESPKATDGEGADESGESDDKASGEGETAPSNEGEAEAEGDTETDAEADTPKDETTEIELTEEELQKKREEWKENRDQIIADNEKKQQEYKDKIDAGRKRVEELNERFSAWYYVISDETYQKVRLGRDDLVKEKEKLDEDTPEGSDGQPAVEDDVEKDGIEKFNELKNSLPPDDDA